uniref:Uncharacterized protein n=1 Tax=Anopheles minimus TaxID=112268 RepID=A0A182WPJ3_9DIPT
MVNSVRISSSFFCFRDRLYEAVGLMLDMLLAGISGFV